MPRRRYRAFTVCAVLVVLLYRLAQNTWVPVPDSPSVRRPPPKAPHGPDGHPVEPPVAQRPQDPREGDAPEPGRVAQGQAGGDKRADLRPPLDRLDKEKTSGKDLGPDEGNADGRVHWTRPEEHFPLPRASLTPLPAGAAKKMPKIQFRFGAESQEAKITRLQRQKRIKTELARSWTGYRKHAWMHDELSPESGRHRDPFCGWAATLVDSLDTLWIAGMKDEFDEAAKAVKDIDFTYTPRPDIPVFETTIRYLGGLIAAFDVSGGHQGAYPFLLDKATELAEILIGIFDTPNRMPMLYYQWKPE